MKTYQVDFINDTIGDFTVECEGEDELKKILIDDLPEYSECGDYGCLFSCDFEDILVNVDSFIDYEVDGCDATPKVYISRTD